MKEALKGLVGAFAELGARWCMLGAQAVNVYGHPRMTADIDVTAELGETTTEQLVSALERHGFTPAFEFDSEFVSATRVVPVVHSSAMPVDIMIAGPGLEELFLESATATKIAGISIPVISAEHLLVSKVLAGREQDLEDVRSVLTATDAIDRSEVESLLRMLESAMGEGDLLPRWRALLK